MKKIVSKLIVFVAGVCTGIFVMVKVCEKFMYGEKERADKNGYIFRCMCKWMKARQQGGSVGQVLKKRDIREIAIYGMGGTGQCLERELVETDIEIKYIIDRADIEGKEKYLRYSPEEELPDVQAIIVTPVYEYAEIAESLRKDDDTMVISLEELVDEMLII